VFGIDLCVVIFLRRSVVRGCGVNERLERLSSHSLVKETGGAHTRFFFLVGNFYLNVCDAIKRQMRPHNGRLVPKTEVERRLTSVAAVGLNRCPTVSKCGGSPPEFVFLNLVCSQSESNRAPSEKLRLSDFLKQDRFFLRSK
jgi:hypothetical protein